MSSLNYTCEVCISVILTHGVQLSLYAGVKVVTSFSYATKIIIDPPTPAVQDVKRDMLELYDFPL